MSKFSPYSPPLKPIKPTKTIEQRDIIDSDILSNYDSIDISRIPDGTDKIVFDVTSGYDEVEIQVNYMSVTKEVENPKYQKQYDLYLIKLAEYKIDIKEWTKFKKEYDADAKLKQDKSELAQYKKLKAKFESVN